MVAALMIFSGTETLRWEGSSAICIKLDLYTALLPSLKRIPRDGTFELLKS
jgi:hypothetical protein